MKVLFVVNPVSGDVPKGELYEDIESFSKKEGIDTLIDITTGNKDSEKIRSLVKNEKPDRIVVVGGDGTVNLVASELVSTGIPMGIVPAGSANGLAEELNIPDGFYKSLDLAIHGDARGIDAIMINNEHYSFHLSDFGFNAKVIKRFEDEGSRGMLGYARQFFSELIDTEPFEFSFIADDGAEHQRKAHLAVIANASVYGTGAVINPGGRLDDGVFELCLIKPQPVSELVKIFTGLFTKSVHESHYFEKISCHNLLIKNTNPELLQIDGELIGEVKKLEAKIIGNCLEVVSG